jgi:hypothetical protein
MLTGAVTYRYDGVTNMVTALNSANFTATAGSNFPGATWIYNLGSTSNVPSSFTSFDNDGNAHQFYFSNGSQDAFLPFSGLGVSAVLQRNIASYNSNFGCYGGCPGTTLLSNTILPPTSAVPEPATWAMMLAGFGIIGFGLRRRARPTVSVAYA